MMSLVLAALTLAAAVQAAPPAPGLTRQAVVYIEDSEFGQALAAAVLKKRVPIIVTTKREQAALVLTETSRDNKEGSAERVAKVIAFGVFAGSGKSYEASVSLTNTDGLVLWAHNARKKDIRRSAEDVAKHLEEHMRRLPR